MEKTRVDWLDVLKFMGIYTIYIAHFLDSAGYTYKFACMYVIQLFFFVSGCFAGNAVKKDTLPGYIRKQGKHLLIPYFLFSALNMGLIVIQENRAPKEVLPLVKQMILGIRNQLFAPALWFLPCLFVVSVLFGILCKLTRKNGMVLVLSFIIYGLVANFLPFDATETPKWFFNIDSALFYLFFFALGAYCFPFMKQMNRDVIREWTMKKKWVFGSIFGVVVIVSMIATLFTFFGRLDYFYLYPVFAAFPPIKWLYPIYIALGCIVIQILLAVFLQRLPFLALLGKKTMDLCGNETIVKTLTMTLLSTLGLQLQIATPLHAYIYAFLLLVLCYYVIIPMEHRLFKILK